MDSCIRGFHIYKETWTPSLGGEHDCQREQGNPQDPYAVAVMHRRLGVVGHVPRLISAACSLFLRRDTSTIKCRITGSRQYSSDLVQGGLEVPCKLIFRGDQKEIAKVKKLILPITTERQVSQENSQSNKKLKLVVPEVIDVDAVVVANDVAPKQWLNRNGIMVTECDKNVIMEGEQLTDKHINFAQQILKNISQTCLDFNLHCCLLSLLEYLIQICIYKFFMTEIATGLLCQQLEASYQKYMYMILCIHLLISIRKS